MPTHHSSYKIDNLYKLLFLAIKLSLLVCFHSQEPDFIQFLTNHVFQGVITKTPQKEAKRIDH